ncbi:PREDICTED: yjeF N-terminal domain-containing protein 3 [Dipodomys ordii]|uniref:YjeF N-terminal domain-containing protein 3 n=1 Tax=Dipodomys ordii TaxID=10020 RepID=A0A1S3G511_DIPOR|nr:PREDICTED: yjeF N-terminal domain-containing protein 3 [Dipodomys ordii]
MVAPPPSAAEVATLEWELLEEYRFGRQQLAELCGQASAVAVTKAFPLPSLPRKQRTVLVVCGPGQNGAVGLVCARHLRIFVSGGHRSKKPKETSQADSLPRGCAVDPDCDWPEGTGGGRHQCAQEPFMQTQQGGPGSSRDSGGWD